MCDKSQLPSFSKTFDLMAKKTTYSTFKERPEPYKNTQSRDLHYSHF